MKFCPTERLLQWITNWRPRWYPRCWMHLGSTERRTFIIGWPDNSQTHNSKNCPSGPTEVLDTPAPGQGGDWQQSEDSVTQLCWVTLTFLKGNSSFALCKVKSSLNTHFLNLAAIMQEMSHIKELHMSANILQGKFNLWDCVFIPTKEHSLSRRAQWGFAGEEGECKKKIILTEFYNYKRHFKDFCV